MLVLSRRLSEKIVFPDFDTVVQIVAIKGNAVRVGIEAPPGVSVVREELLLNGTAPTVPSRAFDVREFRHALRNRLSAGAIGLALLRRQLEMGRADEALATLATVEREFRSVQEKAETLNKVPAPPTAAPRPRRALLVEDDHNERELLAGFLRMAGMDVVTAGDGSDALDYLRGTDRPDVVLLDMVLPRTDGLTTAREIRRDPANERLKIFAVTGHGPDRFGPDGLRDAGIDRLFQKPLNPEALLRDLDRELSPRP